MTVHFPIVFMISVPVFTLLYFITGVRSFETTALHCLGGGLLFSPLAMGSGYLTWWLNYQSRPLRPVKIKQRSSFLMLFFGVIVFFWRLSDPSLPDQTGAAGALYLILVLTLLPLVSLIGWLGARLTFPLEKD